VLTEQFWQSMRQIIREEVNQADKQRPVSPVYETPGLTYKPLYKIAEVCVLFHVTSVAAGTHPTRSSG
jgi:hypothetical protein